MMTAKIKSSTHKWAFTSRFRAKAYSWRSSALAGKRVVEAVKEISKVAKTDPQIAGDGIGLFFKKLVPAIEGIDSSSGSIGNAVNNAINLLVKVFKDIPADIPTRKAWLDRIWQALEEDGCGFRPKDPPIRSLDPDRSAATLAVWQS